MSITEKPQPEQTVDSASYWAAATQGRLELTKCFACQNVFHYPRPLCPDCGSWDTGSFAASGNATVYSFTVVHRAPTVAFKDDVPYVLALVDTEEGARLLTLVREVDVDEVSIGMSLKVAFEQRGEGAIPVFVPASSTVI